MYQQPYQPWPYGGYQPWQPQAPQTQDGEIVGVRRVSGPADAQSVIVPPGRRALLMDADASTFYVKSTDMAGNSTVDAYDFAPHRAEPPEDAYVTRSELRDAVAEAIEGMRRDEPTVQRKQANEPVAGDGLREADGPGGRQEAGGAHYR